MSATDQYQLPLLTPVTTQAGINESIRPVTPTLQVPRCHHGAASHGTKLSNRDSFDSSPAEELVQLRRSIVQKYKLKVTLLVALFCTVTQEYITS
jgi:hypothetical protein